MHDCDVFRKLKSIEQIHLLYKEGVYLGKRKIAGLTILLYQLDAFYIELFYLQYRRRVERVIVHDSVDVLDPYLEQIDVEDLVNE